jgi:hypothetical protein
MRLSGTTSWRVQIGGDPLVDCALWIRDTERLPVADDPLVPGPADVDHPPAPISTSDDVLGADWLGWWYSLVAPERRIHAPVLDAEPAYDTPDPLGLAPYPALAAVVARRWPEAMRWQNSRGHRAPSMTVNQVVAEVERDLGRPVAPFNVEFLVLPVRDEIIRQVSQVRFLVPGPAMDRPDWTGWLRTLFTRLGS